MKKIVVLCFICILVSCKSNTLSAKDYTEEIARINVAMNNEFKVIDQSKNYEAYLEILKKYSTEIIELKANKELSSLESEYDRNLSVYVELVSKIIESNAGVEGKVLSAADMSATINLLQQSLETKTKLEKEFEKIK